MNKNQRQLLLKGLWIIAAKGKEDTMLTTPICKSHWDLKKFNEKIYCKINKKSILLLMEIDILK